MLLFLFYSIFVWLVFIFQKLKNWHIRTPLIENVSRIRNIYFPYTDISRFYTFDHRRVWEITCRVFTFRVQEQKWKELRSLLATNITLHYGLTLYIRNFHFLSLFTSFFFLLLLFSAISRVLFELHVLHRF